MADFNVPPPGPEKKVEIKDISDLPPDERQKMERLFEGLKAVKMEVESGQPEPADKAAEMHTEQPENEADSEDSKDFMPSMTGQTAICPRCGFDTAKSVIQPTKEDEQAFVRQLFGAPFEKTYKLFGGKLSVVLVARMAPQTEAIMAKISELVADNVIDAKNLQRWAYVLNKYQLAVSLKRIEIEGQAPIVYDNGNKSLDELVKEKIEGLPEPVMLVLLQAQKEFEALVDVLTARMMNENLEGAAGSASQ